jgi:zinc protease
MVKFSSHRLGNGLKVLVHEDRSSPLVAMNILYMVGSRDEDPGRTGLAHLFEHLMFGGSLNIPEYDLPLQLAGGDNNAFTNNDITNYYITVPSENIETGFWLESDRMFELDFSQKNLDIQKSVVIQEFKQRYLNQPYGDAMLNMRPLAYRKHPYRWATIGMDISHIQNVELQEVKEFFFSHYAPNNAILTLTGNITPDIGFNLAEKWFGPIPYRDVKVSVYPDEPDQISERNLTLQRDVPSDALYKAWHTCSRGSEEFHALDVATDLLSAGESSRLYTNLVKKQNLFSEINAYLTSEADPGLLVLYGRLMKDIDIETADRAVNEIIDSLKDDAMEDREIEKVRNKFESSTVLANTSILNKAISISFYEMLGNADIINREVENYRSAGKSEIVSASRKYLTNENCSTLYYLSSRKEQR